jgi:peptidoglycan/xylan/chitin deacetylase (PgdA/CDA1 family)
MDYLKQQNFKVVPLEQLLNDIANKKPVADRTVALTFDDGYISVFEHARPILKQYDWPYTVFINSDFVDKKYRRHMNWDQLRIIAKEKATIANHTRQHDYLLHKPSDLTDKQWQQQIADDILHVEKRIKTELGQEHKMLAYPYGEYDKHIQATLKKLGFIGIGQHSGAIGHYTDFTRVPRFPASGIYANLDKLKVKIHSLAMPILSLEQANPVVEHNPPTMILSVELTDIHRHLIQCFSAGTDRAIIKWLDDKRFSVTAPKPLEKGRSRYNCTAPSKQKSGRYYWFSQPWVRVMQPLTN